MTVELELKYLLRDAATGDRLVAADRHGPFTAAGQVRTIQHEDRYVDTSDGALARAGFAARLRTAQGWIVISMKSNAVPAPGDPLHRRQELEGPAARTLDPRAWPPSPARSLILELCGDAPLMELVTIRQLRRKRELRDGDSVAAELSVDEVDVVARGRVVDRFAELEVELLGGDEARLAELARAFADDPELTPASGSKLETALRLASPAPTPSGGAR